MKIVLASKNSGKIKEFNFLFKNTNIELIPISEFTQEDIDETGKSYEENAFIKAEFASRLSGLPAIGDDSGLEVLALDGQPGIYSARYAGKRANDEMNNQKLLDALNEKKERGAKFISVLSFFDFKNKKSIYTFGELHGNIIDMPRGNEGFGYDPIFIPINKKKTFGEMKLIHKYKLDHRSKAFKKIKKFL